MIAVVGEALVDRTVDAAGGVGTHLGGGPFNAARAAARLGVPVTFCGPLSRDAFGRQLRAALASEGVTVDPVWDSDRPTPVASALLAADGTATYRFTLAGTSLEDVSTGRLLAVLTDVPDALHLGSLATTVSPFADAVEAAATALAGRCPVLLDPNVRPAVVADPDAHRARLARLVGLADVVKASDEDLAWMYPGLAPSDAARALLDAGPSLVLRTSGAAGATALSAAGEAHVPAPRVHVVDTIGAGDTFGAAVLAWWTAQGRPDLRDLDTVRAATSFAVAAAAVTCTRRGCDPPYRSELPG